MSLSPGTRLGSYDVLSRIGAGGMGEVFRARDTRLNRDVAIKVMPAAFAEDEERVARFRREAQLVASLNHTSIAAIHGLEEWNGTPTGPGGAASAEPPISILALVLELVEGEDLAQRLARGPVPVDEALAIARQIAEGLEAAHERGIVHRDLKPANVKVTPDGGVKILDFGLAKAYSNDASSGASEPDASQSPTMSRHMTEAGIILGTAAYMSPEQARGRPVDKRSDIWAFGVVLYEMLTGRRLFAGETVTDVLAAVLTREPDLTTLPKGTPASVRRLLARCLVRDPRRRLRDIGEARIALEEPSLAGEQARTADSTPRGGISRGVPWAIAAAALLACGALLLRRPAADAAAQDPMHLDLAYPPDVEPIGSMAAGFAISPDGRAVSMIGVKNGARRLFIHAFGRTETAEVPDTAGSNGAVFSPDGRSVLLLMASGQVARLSLVDRGRKVVADGADATGGLAWGSNSVVFARNGALWISPTDGGSARSLTTLDAARKEVSHADPLVLPGGRTVLFSSLTNEPGTERIEAVSVESGKRSVVVERATTPVLSPSAHLLFARDGAVLAAPFDAKTATLGGGALQVLAPGVVGTRISGSLGIHLSASGTLLYMPFDFHPKRIVSVARDGSSRPLALPPGRYASPRISPDGGRLLFEIGNSALETLDLARGTHSRLTAAAIGTTFPCWNADGTRVVFRRFSSPFWKMADGSGREEPIPHTLVNDYPAGPGPDADSMLVNRIGPETSADIYMVSLSGAFEPRPVVATRAYEGGPQLSPDRRWLLYSSNESGQMEIYVRPFPSLDRRWQVSEGGGAQGLFARSGREITYRSGGHLMSVTLDAPGPTPVFGKPTPLFPDDEYAFDRGLTVPNYDATPDGRFILLRQDARGDTLRAVVHWPEELKKILAAGGVR